MKQAVFFTCVVLFLLAGFLVIAQETGINPVAISPGSETEAVTVWQSCPTFSWSSVHQAAAYMIAIFPANDGMVTGYEEMAAHASPVIMNDIAGPALSWTLSAEESLQNGHIYLWYVRAKDTAGQPVGEWSNGRIFKVEQQVMLAGLEGKLGEILKSHGVSQEVITDTMKDLQSQVKEGAVQNTKGKNTPQRSGIQGTEGATNTFYGLNAGYTNTTGFGNSFLGASAGYTNSSGSQNSFIGYNAGYSNTDGYRNSFFGQMTGYTNTSGNKNSFFGDDAGQFNTTGSYNSFVGQGAGYNNSTGDWNSFIGCNNGVWNTTGSQNSFVGGDAGYSNTVGIQNSFVGKAAGYSNTTGYANSFLGYTAGENNTTGFYNTFIGANAGKSNTTGNQNTFLGYNAGFNETGSNTLYIANSDTNNPLIYGEFDTGILTVNGKLGINTKTPAYTIEANTTGANACLVVKRTDGASNYMNATTSYANFGSTSNHPLRLVVNSIARMTLNTNGSLTMSTGATCTTGGVWTNASSRALKENIENLDTNEAIATLSQLNPVKYNYKTDKTDSYVGFIAEDVPELVASADRKGLSPMDVTAVLTKVVQEQQLLIKEQQKINTELMKRIAEIEKQLQK